MEYIFIGMGIIIIILLIWICSIVGDISFNLSKVKKLLEWKFDKKVDE